MWKKIIFSTGFVEKNLRQTFPQQKFPQLTGGVDKILATMGLSVLFLLLQEKYEKKQSQGALYVLLPQSEPPPCVSPGRIAVGSGAP